jgi:hypothetical protein
MILRVDSGGIWNAEHRRLLKFFGMTTVVVLRNQSLENLHRFVTRYILVL